MDHCVECNLEIIQQTVFEWRGQVVLEQNFVHSLYFLVPSKYWNGRIVEFIQTN